MRIVVLGGGESGYGSAVLAKVKGFDVFLSDYGKLAQEYKVILDRYGIEYEEGRHTEELIYSADLIIKSPGIPETSPIVTGLRERAVKVVSEIEFAGKYTDAKTICITGSNGKTTTTTLIYEILRAAGYDVALAGNIGKSFAYSVATEEKEWYVMELSSFQLDGMFDFHANIAVLMNITPDHLDRYEYDFSKYVESKMRIFRKQLSEDYAVYWDDDNVIPSEMGRRDPKSTWLPFSDQRSEPQGAYMNRDGMVTARVKSRTLTFDTTKMKITGRHNAYNAMAACLAAMAAGVDDAVITNTIYSFGGVEHRMEFAGEIGGVEYINDSKATNVDSTWYALESMKRPAVWIAGGTDKGNDYSTLKDIVARKVKALVCLGIDNSKLIAAFDGVVDRIYDTHSLEDAMEACYGAADEGDTVLLSPACASFDLFKNYEDRGRQFKEWVAGKRGDK